MHLHKKHCHLSVRLICRKGCQHFSDLIESQKINEFMLLYYKEIFKKSVSKNTVVSLMYTLFIIYPTWDKAIIEFDVYNA